MSFLSSKQLSPRTNMQQAQNAANSTMNAEQTPKPDDKKSEEKPEVPAKKAEALA